MTNRRPKRHEIEKAERRPFLIRQGKKMRGRLDRIIACSSLTSNDPVLESTLFDWTGRLEEAWVDIRAEALAVMAVLTAIPLLEEISPDHRRIAQVGKWRSFFLRGYGFDIADNIGQCPKTWSALQGVPGLNTAFFSILAPGTHIPRHRGVTKGLLTCHLGLVVPQGQIEMQVGPELVRWREGRTLVFDDTYHHEVWNNTDETRLVLLIQFARPLRTPGRWLASAFLAGIKRSAFVREARANLANWETRLQSIEAAYATEDHPHEEPGERMVTAVR